MLSATLPPCRHCYIRCSFIYSFIHSLFFFCTPECSYLTNSCRRLNVMVYVERTISTCKSWSHRHRSSVLTASPPYGNTLRTPRRKSRSRRMTSLKVGVCCYCCCCVLTGHLTAVSNESSLINISKFSFYLNYTSYTLCISIFHFVEVPGSPDVSLMTDV